MAGVVVARPTGYLPAELTTFIGRRRELAEAKRLLGTVRLITLTGVSGVGKTRLALRVAAETRRSFGGGVWFVELSSLTEADLLPSAVARALGLPGQPARDPLDLLVEHLDGQHLLLILDTCEHLVDAAAKLAEVVLRAAPRVRILATSREPLDVPGETAMTVAPLDVPDPDGPWSPAIAQRFDAMSLFVDRATAVVPGFALTAENRGAVARLCLRLDGLPLAIELAVARLRALTADQLVARLDDRFRLLAGSRTTLGRHQTLRAAVGWSHDLCTPGERLLWARLSVFAGGFDLESAERVCYDQELPIDTVLPTLARLVEKSIVVREEYPGGIRFRMLDTIRDYGMERLREAGEVEDALRRHRDWFRSLALSAEMETVGAQQSAWFARFGRDYPNLRAALEYSLGTPGEAREALTMCAALAQYWLASGQFTEARRWLARALKRDGPGRARALCAAGMFAVLQNDLATGSSLCSQAATLAGQLGDKNAQALAAQLEGLLAFFGNDLDRARELWENSPGDDSVWSIFRLPLLATVYCLAGDLDRAVSYCEKCLAPSEGIGDQWCRTYALWVRGLSWCLRGEPEAAMGDAVETLRSASAFDDHLGVTMAFDLIAGCAGFTGNGDKAARLFGAAGKLWNRLSASMFGPAYLTFRELTVAQARAGADPDRWREMEREGAEMSLGEVISYALGESPSPAPAPPHAAVPRGSLTRRQLEIAELVAEGLSNRDIADRLVIAKRTVDSHVEHVLAKLGFTSRTQIAAWVVEQRRS